jgi:hypothetical protein
MMNTKEFAPMVVRTLPKTFSRDLARVNRNGEKEFSYEKND